MSAPVLNTPPVPRRITTLMSSSAASSSRNARIWRRIGGSYALRRSGLSSVMRATWAAGSRSRCTRSSVSVSPMVGQNMSDISTSQQGEEGLRTMAYETILYEVADRTATITFNRPDRLNAISEQMEAELHDAYMRAEEDDDVWT